MIQEKYQQYHTHIHTTTRTQIKKKDYIFSPSSAKIIEITPNQYLFQQNEQLEYYLRHQYDQIIQQRIGFGCNEYLPSWENLKYHYLLLHVQNTSSF